MIKSKHKHKILRKSLSTISLVVLVFQLMVSSTYATTSSPSFTLAEEGINFAHSDTSTSTSYSLTASTLYWTDRLAESSSFVIADSNSGVASPLPPPPPPPPPPPAGGGTSGGGGGGPLYPQEYDDGIYDVPVILSVPIVFEIDVPVEPPAFVEEKEIVEDKLHEAAQIEETIIAFVEDFVEEVIEEDETIQIDEDYEYAEVFDDNDACSYEYERLYLGTDPYKNDTDGDGIEDCDEAIIYGLDQLIYNTINDNVEVTHELPYTYTSQFPLLVGRVDQDTGIKSEEDVEVSLRIINEEDDQFIDFPLNLKNDQNFAYIVPYEFDDGFYKINLIVENEVIHENLIYINNANKDEFLFDLVNDENALFYGQSDPNIRINAIWYNNDLVDVATTVSDSQGKFKLDPPQKFAPGEYNVVVYGISNDLIQSNYFNYFVSVGNDGEIISIEKITLSFPKLFEDDLKKSADEYPVYLRMNLYFLIFVFLFMIGTIFYLKRIKIKK